MTDAQEKLRQLACQPLHAALSGPLYQWLYKYYNEVRELREEGIIWKEIARIVSEDKIEVRFERRGFRHIGKKWRAVC